MRLPGCVLLYCLLPAGCCTPEPLSATTSGQPAESASEHHPEGAVRAPTTRGRFEQMRESAAINFFTGVEQVGTVLAFPFQAAMTGLYVLFFPLVGFGHGGPG
jgi:hypothetical protein